MNDEKIVDECCPPFNPELWHEKEFQWENKLFVKTRVCTLFFMPLNFGGKMRKIVPKIEKAGVEMTDGMVLGDHVSPWKMYLYIAVNKAVPGTEVVSFTGRFISRVYEGSYQNTAKWCKDFEEKEATHGRTVKKLYMWYVYCPKCAKKYGKNHTAIIGEVVKN
jgi:hypothetical protein